MIFHPYVKPYLKKPELDRYLDRLIKKRVVTPQKSNIDTKNGHISKPEQPPVPSRAHPFFWVYTPAISFQQGKKRKNPGTLLTLPCQLSPFRFLHPLQCQPGETPAAKWTDFFRVSLTAPSLLLEKKGVKNTKFEVIVFVGFLLFNYHLYE